MFESIPQTSGPCKHCACPTGRRRLHAIRWQAHKNEEDAALELAHQRSLNAANLEQRQKLPSRASRPQAQHHGCCRAMLSSAQSPSPAQQNAALPRPCSALGKELQFEGAAADAGRLDGHHDWPVAVARCWRPRRLRLTLHPGSHGQCAALRGIRHHLKRAACTATFVCGRFTCAHTLLPDRWSAVEKA